MCGCSCWMYSSKYLAFSIFSLFIFMAVPFIVGNCQSLKSRKEDHERGKGTPRRTRVLFRSRITFHAFPIIPTPQASVCPLVNELKAKL